MNLLPDPGSQAFRNEVRAFLVASLPRDTASRNRGVYHSSREDAAAWPRILHDAGWPAPGWPQSAAPPGWSLAKQLIFAEEAYLAAPRANLQGFTLAGPVIYTYGNDEQKARYLPPILKGEEFWAQGFPESGAGSDLASLRTRTNWDGENYLVNGQKIWT